MVILEKTFDENLKVPFITHNVKDVMLHMDHYNGNNKIYKANFKFKGTVRIDKFIKTEKNTFIGISVIPIDHMPFNATMFKSEFMDLLQNETSVFGIFKNVIMCFHRKGKAFGVRYLGNDERILG